MHSRLGKFGPAAAAGIAISALAACASTADDANAPVSSSTFATTPDGFNAALERIKAEAANVRTP